MTKRYTAIHAACSLFIQLLFSERLNIFFIIMHTFLHRSFARCFSREFHKTCWLTHLVYWFIIFRIFLPAFVFYSINCCVALLYFVFNIEQGVEVCDATMITKELFACFHFQFSFQQNFFIISWKYLYKILQLIF